jgi:DNA helicase HerA-like ATPase
MGPLMLARLLGLNDVQQGVLTLLFRYADDQGLLLLDLKDLRALLAFASEQPQALASDYGNVSKASLGAIQRALLQLEQQGAESFFGEPMLALEDIMRRAPDGRGVINILAADQLILQPLLYATVQLWLLAELFENLPERGDTELPLLVFFFDEAHLLFDGAPKALLDKIEQVVRLIRSKGVGVYFVTQSPTDLPDDVLGQLGNRVQHALRAFTPKDQKAVKAAAQTFRANPGVDVATVITELGVGEALVSTLGQGGVPSPVERALICPPRARVGAITPAERQAVMQASPLSQRYDQAIDRESAYERLQQRAVAHTAPTPRETPARDDTPAERTPTRRGREPDSLLEAAAKSALRAASSELGRRVGRQLLRGLLGTLGKAMK